MALSPVRAAALAERLEIPFDGICDGPRSATARVIWKGVLRNGDGFGTTSNN